MMKTKLFFLLAIVILAKLEAQNTWFIKQNGTGDGTSWQNASGNLQKIMTFASFGDEVWVGIGTYKPTKIPSATFYNPTTPKDYSFYV